MDIVVLKLDCLPLSSWHASGSLNVPAGDCSSYLHSSTVSGVRFFQNEKARVIICTKSIVPSHQPKEVELQARRSLLDHTDCWYNEQEGSLKGQGFWCSYKNSSLIYTMCRYYSKTRLDTNTVTVMLRVTQIK